MQEVDDPLLFLCCPGRGLCSLFQVQSDLWLPADSGWKHAPGNTVQRSLIVLAHPAHQLNLIGSEHRLRVNDIQDGTRLLHQGGGRQRKHNSRQLTRPKGDPDQLSREDPALQMRRQGIVERLAQGEGGSSLANPSGRSAPQRRMHHDFGKQRTRIHNRSPL